MQNFDLICVLGYAFDDQGILPSHVYPRLKKVANLYKSNIAPMIALAGKWNPPKDQLPQKPAETEAHKMKNILIQFGVPENKIIKEEESQDTIGNAYFLKDMVVEHYHFKNILIVCADYHVKRVTYIFRKIFGPSYTLSFLSTPTKHISDKSFMALQEEIFIIQRNKLQHMTDGDHTFLKGKI